MAELDHDYICRTHGVATNMTEGIIEHLVRKHWTVTRQRFDNDDLPFSVRRRDIETVDPADQYL